MTVFPPIISQVFLFFCAIIVGYLKKIKIFQIFNATNFGEPLVEFIGLSILTFLYEKVFVSNILKAKLSRGVARLDDSERCIVPMSQRYCQ